MKSPGVSVRPLCNLASAPGFNQVFFENVRVPKKDLLGEENRGWYIATTTLDFERSSIGAAIAQQHMVEDLVLFVRERSSTRGDSVRVHPTIRYELGERAIEAAAARLLSHRVITLQNKGLVPNYEASIAKLYATELNQRVAATGIRIVGLYGMLDRDGKAGSRAAANRWAPLRGRLMRGYLWAVAATIAGGTSEIQRGIIATRGLGLPRSD